MSSPRVAFSLGFAALAVVSLAVKAHDMAHRERPDIAVWHDPLVRNLTAQGFVTRDLGSSYAVLAERSSCRIVVRAEPLPDADRALRVEEPELRVLRYRYRGRWSDRYPRLAVMAGRIESSLWQKIDPSAPAPIAVVVSSNHACRRDAIDFGPQEVVNRLPPPAG